MMQRLIYGFKTVFLNRKKKKEKIVKAFLFSVLTLDYDRRDGFVRH